MSKGKDLTNGPVMPMIYRMTGPMIGGMFALTAFNVVDTFYVSMLGTDALAAMGFTFPVVMVIMAVAMGLGLGLSTILAHRIGSGDQEAVKRLTTHGIILTMLLTGSIALLGIVTAPPIFRLLGAEGEVLELTLNYMNVWYFSAWTVFVPMVSNYAIRATGNTKTPARIMVVSSVLNAILDPIFIFGWGVIPAMGITGAALATALSRAINTVVVLLILHRRYHMIDFKWPKWAELLTSWKELLHMASPVILTNLTRPLATAIVTWMVAIYGKEAVAGLSAGDRVLMLLYMVPMAMGSVLIPFCGQNFGAKRIDRIEEAWRKTNRFGYVYGVGCLVLVIFTGKWLLRPFSTEAAVVDAALGFLLYMFISSGWQFAAVHAGFVLNAMKLQFWASFFNIFRSILLMVVFVWLGRLWFGLTGIFMGMALSQILGSLSVNWFVGHRLRKMQG